MPNAAMMTWTGQKLEPARYPQLATLSPILLKHAASGTVLYAKGTVMGRVLATGLYDAYASTNSDGTEVAAGILAYDCAVDTSGNIILTTTASQAGGEWGQTLPSIGMYTSGQFYGKDLLQSGAGSLDSGAITDLGGHFVDGDLTNGLFIF